MKIDIDVPDGISGNVKVETFEVPKEDFSQFISMMKSGRGVPVGTYKRLLIDGTCVMSNTPDEIRDFSQFVYRATGNVLVNGLGLGVLLKALLNKIEITSITVIEKSSDVIQLIAPTYLVDSRVTIINADAFTYTPKGIRYDAVWHDIWNYLCEDNLEEMKTLTRKYGKRADHQASWGRELIEYRKKQNRNYGY